METGNQSHSYYLVLPTPSLPPALAANNSQSQPQFILGYRNVITTTSEGPMWGLIKSASHCARVFCFRLSEAETYNIQQLKKEDEYIENVGDNFIILKIEKSLNKPKDMLMSESVLCLLDSVGGLNKINLNLVKNTFESFEEYKRVIPVQFEFKLQSISPKREIQVAQRVQIQLNGKQLSGKQLLLVPVIIKQTGDCLQKQTLALKLIEH